MCHFAKYNYNVYMTSNTTSILNTNLQQHQTQLAVTQLPWDLQYGAKGLKRISASSRCRDLK
jgi:hypothetical protein